MFGSLGLRDCVHVTCVNQPTVAGAVCGSHMTHARSKSVFSVTVCLRMRTEVFVTLFLTLVNLSMCWNVRELSLNRRAQLQCAQAFTLNNWCCDSCSHTQFL